jgi:predicted DNA-binding transcriptional regulator AlpA
MTKDTITLTEMSAILGISVSAMYDLRSNNAQFPREVRRLSPRHALYSRLDFESWQKTGVLSTEPVCFNQLAVLFLKQPFYKNSHD